MRCVCFVNSKYSMFRFIWSKLLLCIWRSVWFVRHDTLTWFGLAVLHARHAASRLWRLQVTIRRRPCWCSRLPDNEETWWFCVMEDVKLRERCLHAGPASSLNDPMYSSMNEFYSAHQSEVLPHQKLCDEQVVQVGHSGKTREARVHWPESQQRSLWAGSTRSSAFTSCCDVFVAVSGSSRFVPDRGLC